MNIRNARDLGLLLRQRRKDIGMGQQTLATRLGVSRYWVSQLENGNSGASLGHALNALALLGITLNAQTRESSASTSPNSTDQIARILAASRG